MHSFKTWYHSFDLSSECFLKCQVSHSTVVTIKYVRVHCENDVYNNERKTG